MKTENDNEVRVHVEVCSREAGHACMELTQPETLAIVEQNSDTHWVFAGGRLVEVAQLADADWAEMAENNTTVQLVPQLVGGL